MEKIATKREREILKIVSIKKFGISIIIKKL